ncbi:hypothetical protein dsx2_1658 [Desulfovibrio sp. X2]|uniref:hypothetical protein n=1 Tax=Desulfovibrio sp. X2 TaxID=941449 RepID=UPI000358E8B1|nr:hypothetical protein [Desulfovibrio sp. X2]EPR44297.1 hypothetical protein dsx2_1658 [Desulfovibrio sp. X2]
MSDEKTPLAERPPILKFPFDAGDRIQGGVNPPPDYPPPDLGKLPRPPKTKTPPDEKGEK